MVIERLEHRRAAAARCRMVTGSGRKARSAAVAVLIVLVAASCAVEERPAADGGSEVETHVGSAPTAAAARAAQALTDRRGRLRDCGTWAADSGWPTTTMASPAASGCLMEAYADRRPAIMTFTGRTGDGGALVTEYEVTGSATLQVSRHVVDDDGRTESTQSECTPPPGDWLVGVQGGVALSTDVAFC